MPTRSIGGVNIHKYNHHTPHILFSKAFKGHTLTFLSSYINMSTVLRSTVGTCIEIGLKPKQFCISIYNTVSLSLYGVWGTGEIVDIVSQPEPELSP